MAVVEEVTDDGQEHGQSKGASRDNTVRELQRLAAALVPSEELLEQSLNTEDEALRVYRASAESIIQRFQTLFSSIDISSLPLPTLSSILLPVLRLSQPSPYTSPELRQQVSNLTSSLPAPAELALHILTEDLKPLFRPTQHPMLNPSTSRALQRPAGGRQAFTDFSDSSAQRFKSPSGWGCDFVLAWCCDQLDAVQVEKHVGLILPPTLVMMDDWDPPWRGRGVAVLGKWVDKVDTTTLRRMGLDKLLLDSLIHTLSLHPNPPLPRVLPAALRLVERTTSGQVRADRLAEIMDKAVLQGWMYASSGSDGRVVLIDIAHTVEQLCRVFGAGIARWLKSIIPNLLEPLQYPPTRPVLAHFRANLSALSCTIETLRGTERIPRWRGKILDVLGRLWLHLAERGDLVLDPLRPENADSDPPDFTHIRALVVAIFRQLEAQCPSVRTHEFQTLLELDSRTFAPLVEASS